jgi:cellulose synthase/poly-beta-1,6-N-acetylglucosamine synthase-like glycosyltransferase
MLSYDEAKTIPDPQLPIVTILLPMYREALMPPYLFQSIANIDYPKDKLDVRILIEYEDKETLESIKYLATSDKNMELIKSNDNSMIYAIKVWNRVLINIDYVTEGIRTKPNALNIGLRHAKGKILCIYDAEDRPEEKQVRTCVAYMMKHPDVACVQARLAYYNHNQSMLTKLFAIEYNFQYFVSLPTYFSLNNIILLGGTSNFFRIEPLKSLGGWDPKNVTEDADLGIRMARNHHSIVPIDVVTYEEAPPKAYPWLKQRIRWNKGYLYTLLVHFRNPLKIFKKIGLKSSIFLFHQLSSPIIAALTLPNLILFVLYWLNWFGMPLEPVSNWITSIFNPNPLLFYSSLLTLAFGPVYSILMSLEGLFRQEDDYALSKVKYVPLAILYFLLQSVASLIAIVELIVRPHLWHKTPHGFSLQNKELSKLAST